MGPAAIPLTDDILRRALSQANLQGRRAANRSAFRSAPRIIFYEQGCRRQPTANLSDSADPVLRASGHASVPLPNSFNQTLLRLWLRTPPGEEKATEGRRALETTWARRTTGR